eukprot:4713788-Prymnesium_polylepis.2
MRPAHAAECRASPLRCALGRASPTGCYPALHEQAPRRPWQLAKGQSLGGAGRSCPLVTTWQ